MSGADGVFNVSKGRIVELFRRVDSNDPAASGLIIHLWQAIEADATIEDYDDVAAMEGQAGNTEATFTNYAPITLTDTDIADAGPDDTNNRYDIDIGDPVWSNAGGATNNTLVKLTISYDDDTGTGTDANLVLMTFHTFDITTNGGDLTGNVNAAGFARAS